MAEFGLKGGWRLDKLMDRHPRSKPTSGERSENRSKWPNPALEPPMYPDPPCYFNEVQRRAEKKQSLLFRIAANSEPTKSGIASTRSYSPVRRERFFG
jgi:hypothetical protein